MNEQRVLHPSAIKSIGMAVSSGIIAFLCFRFWIDGLEYGWIAGSFLALGAAFYMMHLVPSAYSLTLSHEGFEVMELYAYKRYSWTEVSEFMVRRGILGASVEFFHHPSDGSLPKGIKLNETFGYRPYMMVEVMNEWRDRVTAKSAGKNIWQSGSTEER